MSIDKNASFMEGMLGTIKDKLQLKTKPFETIFGAAGPMLIMSRSKMLGALLLVGEYLGYGPGIIGKMIDRALGFGGETAVGESDVTDEKLQTASTSIVDTIWKKLGLTSEAMISDIYRIKKSVTINDLVSVAAYYHYNPVPIKKEAVSRTRFLRRYMRKMTGGSRLGLINALWSVLKAFAKGLIGLGIIGGVASKVKEWKGDEGKEDLFTGKDTFRPKAPTKLLGQRQSYVNTKRNVRNTIVHFLDSAYKIRREGAGKYKTFSEIFRENAGYPLRNSREMDELLRTIEAVNSGDIQQINKRRTFVAPPLELIAKEFLPLMKLEEGTTDIPLSKRMPKADPAAELDKALRGVL